MQSTEKARSIVPERSAERAYELGPKDQLLLARSERAPRQVKVIYHSHCDAGAYFSAEDAATFASENTLMWPCAFIVVSVMQGEVKETKLWVHEPGTNDFRESSLTIQ